MRHNSSPHRRPFLLGVSKISRPTSTVLSPHCAIAKQAKSRTDPNLRWATEDEIALAVTLQKPWTDTEDFGAGSRTRTDDLLITNQLLYQLSYAGKAWTGEGSILARVRGLPRRSSCLHNRSEGG